MDEDTGELCFIAGKVILDSLANLLKEDSFPWD